MPEDAALSDPLAGLAEGQLSNASQLSTGERTSDPPRNQVARMIIQLTQPTRC